MAERIETSPNGRTTCRFCGRLIAKGELRFGTGIPTQPTYRSRIRWFHVACGEKHRPKVFARARERFAGEIPGAAPDAAPRDAGPVAALLANPDDEEARAVYADWLQSKSDPWGEYIAVSLAGREAHAKEVFSAHSKSWLGGLPPKDLGFRKGFIEWIYFRARTPALASFYDTVRAVPAAMLVRSITVWSRYDRAFIQRLSENPPPVLDSLRLTSAGAGIAALSVPRLSDLSLRYDARHLEEVDGLADASLPGLRVLSIEAHERVPIPASSLRRLFQSQTVGALVELAIDVRDLDGIELLIDESDALGHLKKLRVPVPRDAGLRRALHSVFGRRLPKGWTDP